MIAARLRASDFVQHACADVVDKIPVIIVSKVDTCTSNDCVREYNHRDVRTGMVCPTVARPLLGFFLASFPGPRAVFGCTEDTEGLVSFLMCVMSRVERW